MSTTEVRASEPLPDLPAIGAAPISERPIVSGKFLYHDKQKLWIRGVTYGTFRPDPAGDQYGTRSGVQRDFAQIAAHRFNSVRTYTTPPRWVLDCAAASGLFVMVGVPWEQHVAFLDQPGRARRIEAHVRQAAAACAGHPAVLGYAIGNEIPTGVVRWYGRRRVERFIERLYRTTKAEDPRALVTYVNYPSTEYLDLPFLDLACFNVYLESQDRLEAYLARLHNLVGERPLVMGEIGLDSRRNGAFLQARALDWQVRTTFASGCAGAFVFGWTDEWHRGGYDVEDWDFGLTDRDRRPKPALMTVQRAMEEAPFPATGRWPRISVVVCTYNGARTIGDCLDGVSQLQYPNFEVIVVNDGSTDETASIVREYDVQLVTTPNRGLSSARNTGLSLATGEIVAYIDDDARPDPDWLTYLGATFRSTDHVGVGGPNLPPPSDGPVADCVANAPGGPLHVLVTDREAEHLPGCNMAFRKSALEAIGGFDPQFRAAGDDVDVCWRLQQRGGTLGFHPAAIVWHHRRNSVAAYWRQQRGYGRAEAMLARKWPGKYNAAGHIAWAGRLYGRGLAGALTWRRGRVYSGTWGSAPYQALYQPPADGAAALLLMPEWYGVVGLLGVLAALGAGLWSPLLWLALPAFVAAGGAVVARCLWSGLHAAFPDTSRDRWATAGRRALTALLHFLQPLARLSGRVRHGLTPWRDRDRLGLTYPRPGRYATWSEQWKDPASRLEMLEDALRVRGARVVRGGDFDGWDLEVQGGLFGAVRAVTVTEDHGGGRQLVRLRWWPRVPAVGALLPLAPSVLALAAALTDAPGAAGVLAALGALLVAGLTVECGIATSALRDAIGALGKRLP